MDIVLSFDQVAKSFPTPSGVPQMILKDLSFSLSTGQSMAVVGPSGCGKSTLLNLAGTLDRPDSGAIRIAGRDPSAMTEPDLATLRGEQIGFVFQAHHLLPQCTVLENVLVPLLAVASRVTDAEEAYARELLERVGLASRLPHRPGQLSGGECQRVAVVRALIRKPKLILADEPTGALDGASAAKLTELLFELGAAAGTALLLVTHSEVLAARAGTIMRLRTI